MNLLFTLLITSSAIQAQQSHPAAVQFVAADDAGKRAALYEIATSKSRLPIEAVIEVVRLAVQHDAPEVRMAAMAAIAGRAMAAGWAGTTEPGLGPSPPGAPRSSPRQIPAEWRTDQQTLRSSLLEACLQLLRGDVNERVREQALLAVGNLERPANPQQPIQEEFVSLLIDLYETDANDRIRAEIVKTFRLVSNDSDRVRVVLRDALIDKAAGVRFEALTAITPEAVGGVPKLSFEEASGTILVGIKQGEPAIRLNAVRALNLFGASAKEQLPLLEMLRANDPDSSVRDSARLAIESIRRDLQRIGPAGRGR